MWGLIALTSCLPFKPGYFACKAAQPAGAAAWADIGAQMPANRNTASDTFRNSATRKDCGRVRAFVEKRICICFLLRRCHGDAMFQVRRKPTVTSACKAFPGGYKMLDQRLPGFGQQLRVLWGAGGNNNPGALKLKTRG